MQKLNLLHAAACLALASTLLFSSCKKDRPVETPTEVLTPGPDVNFYALTSDSKLLLVNAKTPNTVTSSVTLSGLQTGETILGIDFRPATGQLYGIGSTSRIYVIDPRTGSARAINSTPFSPAISGTSIGFDFNPTVDRIRLITSGNQNLRLHPETGAVVATDGVINGVTNAKTTAAAYTMNKAGATTTVLYDIDVTNDKLHKQDPPNDGKLVEVGSLGYDVEDAAGFDINPSGTAALAAMSVAGVSSLFNIDLTTGKASKIGAFGVNVIGIAIPTEPVAYSISTANELLIFNPLAPTPIVKAITGLQTGETILGIDMRPINGQLFAMGSTSRLYSINVAAAGATATLVGTGPLSTLIVGTDIGIDFNPTVDLLRVVTSSGQNFRINPTTGALTVDLAISLSTSVISGAAYTNNFAGATTTALYDIDSQGDRLYRQDPPNNGTLVDVGPLGVNVEVANGFDIGGTSGIAYGIFTVSGAQKIYTVNLTTGAATGGVTFPQAVKGFALGLGF